MRKLAAFLFLMLSFASLVPFLYMHEDTKETPQGTTKIFTVGLPSSPWLTLTETSTKPPPVEGATPSATTSNRKIELFSVSWLFVVATIVFFQIRRVLLGVDRPPPGLKS
jgi:hypothetical protein